MGAWGIGAVGGGGKWEMREEDKHKSQTKQIAGSNATELEAFKRKH